MVVVERGKESLSCEIWGKIGKPNGLGRFMLGFSNLGEHFPFAGYYNRRRTSKSIYLGTNFGIGKMQLGACYFGLNSMFAKIPGTERRLTTRMKHYYPTNPQTEAQQNWRAIFANGVAEWHSLTAEEKLYYNRLKYPARQSGFTRFMSKYLAQNYTPE